MGSNSSLSALGISGLNQLEMRFSSGIKKLSGVQILALTTDLAQSIFNVVHKKKYFISQTGYIDVNLTNLIGMINLRIEP